MDLLDLLDDAIAAFRVRLVRVGDGDWARATPCAAWDVRFLVAHVVGGHLFASNVLAGVPADDAIATLMSTSVLGDDPIGRHDEFAAAQRQGSRRAGALEVTIYHPAGPMTGATFLAMRVFDVTVYAWDLARATAGDERIDEQLAAHALAAISAVPGGAGFGIIPTGATNRDDPALARLLDLSGRRSSPA